MSQLALGLEPFEGKPWEWCAECETDLREWLHADGCPALQRLIDWHHEKALAEHCRGCGHHFLAPWHPESCAVEQAAQAAFRLRVAAYHAFPRAPLHWPPPCLMERPAFGAWLEKCHGWGYAHGSELVDSLCDEGSVGSADGDGLLTLAIEVSWVKQADFSPTRAQHRLGVAGAFDMLERYPSTYGYVPAFERRAGGESP